LEALLAYANYELENCEHLPIKFNWHRENELVVETQVRFLEELTNKDPYPGRLTKEQIKFALKYCFKGFLGILRDNRPGARGLHDWNFTLVLWHRRQDWEENLKQLDLEWKRRLPEKSKSVLSLKRDDLPESPQETPEICNDRGLEHYLADRLPQAVSDFTKALEFDPNFAETHYNLGSLYEDLRDFDKARAEYRVAILGGLAAAYNNLARLYILDKDYAAAVDLLLKGLKVAEHEAEKYALRKNLGWARLGQGRYAEAKAELLLAIELNREQAPAYGLLAQALEGLGEKIELLVAWENCLRYASSYRPDEDAWIDLARQRLAQLGN
jgi:tetratricopeptide (TPR) repeat protein